MKYLRRRAELDKPDPRPLTVKEWKTRLRGGMKRQRLIQTYREEARKVVDGILGITQV